jgi:deazaflavin-dependent oxidoreductase (nitroreductase family)
MEDVVKSRPGTWFAINIANPIDRRLLRWTGGRIGTFIGQPVGLLETTGARSGAPRTTPLLYLRDGERVVLVASKGGAPRHPAWYHNLRANPEVAFTCRDGQRRRYRARPAAGEEREALWGRCNDLYAGYDEYALRTGGRVIPVVVLEPVAAGA